MATLTTTAHSSSIKTAHGGSFSSGDAVYVSQYADDYSGDLNQAAVDFVAMVFTANWSGNIVSGVFKFTCDRTSTGEVQCLWAGDRLLLGGAGGGSTVWYRLIVDPAAGGLVEVFDVNVKNGYVSGGRTIFWDGVDLDNLTVDGGSALVVTSGTYGTVDTLTMSGGAVELQRNATTVSVSGGRLKVTDVAFAPTTMTVTGGVVEVLNHSGAITTLNAYGGVVDFSQLNRPLTITTLNCRRGARISPPANASLLTITTKNLGPGGYDPTLQG